MKYTMNTALNGIAEYKRVLTAAALITTLYYETTSVLIFSTPRSNKVIKVTNLMALSVGDAWTSGTTITNEVSLFAPYNDSWSPGATVYMVVTPDIFGFTHAHPTSAGLCNNYIFGRLNNAGAEYIFISSKSGTSVLSNTFAKWYNTSIGEIWTAPFQLYPPMTDASAFFNTFDMPFKHDATNIYRAGVINGFKWLFKAAVDSEPLHVFSPDITIPVKYFQNVATQVTINCSMLIVNGDV